MGGFGDFSAPRYFAFLRDTFFCWEIFIRRCLLGDIYSEISLEISLAIFCLEVFYSLE